MDYREFDDDPRVIPLKDITLRVFWAYASFYLSDKMPNTDAMSPGEYRALCRMVHSDFGLL